MRRHALGPTLRFALALLLALAGFVWLPRGPVPPVQAQAVTPGSPIRLVIPDIQLDAPISPAGWRPTSQGIVWDIPAAAVGWLSSSALPGQPGNLVLYGHHNIEGKVFRNLQDVQVGDTLAIYTADAAFVYVVDQRTIVREAGVPAAQRRANARWIGPFPDERVTLVTCYPAWTNTHRLILVAKPLRM